MVTCRNASHVPFITTPASLLPAQPPEAAAWISNLNQLKNHLSALSVVKDIACDSTTKNKYTLPVNFLKDNLVPNECQSITRYA